MKNCADWEQDIAAELESAELEQHLQTCERCSEFAQELSKNRAALAGLTVDPAAFTAVRQRVLSEIQTKRQRKSWWAWSAAAAAACIAILSVAYILPKNPAAPAPLVARITPPRIQRTPLQQPVRQVAARHRIHHKFGPEVAKALPAQKTPPIVAIKMLTDDPNVIIIWLVDRKGDSL